MKKSEDVRDKIRKVIKTCPEKIRMRTKKKVESKRKKNMGGLSKDVQKSEGDFLKTSKRFLVNTEGVKKMRRCQKQNQRGQRDVRKKSEKVEKSAGVSIKSVIQPT